MKSEDTETEHYFNCFPLPIFHDHIHMKWTTYSLTVLTQSLRTVLFNHKSCVVAVVSSVDMIREKSCKVCF